MSTTVVEKKIEQWKRDLIDLSRRNRLLFFRPTKLGHVLIDSPDAASIVERLVVQKKFLRTPRPPKENHEEDSAQLQLVLNQDNNAQIVDARHYTEGANDFPSDPYEITVRGSHKQLETALYRMRLQARTAIEEQGVNILFMAVGFLEWYEAGCSEESVRSPIILIPVELKRAKDDRPAEIHSLEDEVIINPALAYALQLQYNLKIPELPEDFGDTVDQYHNYLDQIRSLIDSYPRWKVHEEACLGLFSFTKFIMFKDLDDHKQQLMEHPIISALAGDYSKLPKPPDDIPLAHELDDRVDPKHSFHVLDTDSSQQEAIEAAKHGVSFVLQGPPGTGKSQTITNIIAELLAQNKTVLFVSEKMAALEVVYSRLQEVGLNEFCLELHSHKANKKLIVQELERCLNGKIDPEIYTFDNVVVGVETIPTSVDRELEQLGQYRRDLNNYVRALHRSRTKLEISPFQAYTRLAELVSAPRVSLGIKDISEVTPGQLREWESILEKIERNSALWNRRKEHPWRGVRAKTFSFSLRDELDEVLRQTADVLADVHGRLADLCSVYGLMVPTCVADADRTVRVVLTLTPRFWEQNRSQLRELAERFAKWEASSKRVINPKYWMDAWQGRRWWAQTGLSIQKRAEILRLAASIQIEDRRQPAIVERSQIEDKVKKLKARHDKLRTLLERLGQLLDLDLLVPDTGSFETVTIDNLIKTLQSLPAHLGELEPWMAFRTDMDRARKLGLGPFLEAADDLNAEQLLPAFQRAFYERWVDNVHAEEPILQKFKGEDHQALIDRFRELDLKSVRYARARIRAALQANRPSGSWLTAPSSETSIVHKEARKKRGHLSIRKLFQRIPGLLPRIKPCMLMSPLSVSQYIDPEIYTFDAVIFDEASQIKPEDAVGSIMRARQIIVVGDSKQLPPTSFFDRLVGDDLYADEDQEEIAQFESILDACLSIGLPEKKLTWHYRSRDESLIAFSNLWFYENSLVTFRHANPKDNGFGVEFVYVEEGIYDRSKSRTNRVEAARVVQLVLQHYQERPHKSLGVVAFSEAQQLAILQELDRLRKKYPDFGAWLDADTAEPFFVKNLENVQGDERDVIFISVGYGKDASDKLTLNFGPLNKDGGERRLNVVATRAKEQLKLVSSIRADDIDLARSNKEGVRLLKEYLQFAEHGPETLQRSTTVNSSSEPESPFEQQVLEALQRKGLSVDVQVGVSGYRIDLAVKDPKRPGRYILGIECDGATYHAAKTARDRDRLRQQILENRGWKIHRIWSRDWFMHPEREVEKVLRRLKEIQEIEIWRDKRAASSDAASINPAQSRDFPGRNPNGQ